MQDFTEQRNLQKQLVEKRSSIPQATGANGDGYTGKRKEKIS